MNIEHSTLNIEFKNKNQRDLRNQRLSKMKKAFTLIEVVAAIALLAMMLTFSGIIYSVSIDSYRMASANAEIMRKFRAITGQLDSDLAGLRKDAPMFMWFDHNDVNHRFDQIMFFADGDFQAVNSSIIGNTARIYYGQGRGKGTNENPWNLKNSKDKAGRYRDREIVLARRQHILTSGVNGWFVKSDFSDFEDAFTSTNGFYIHDNDIYEYDANSLSEWKVFCDDNQKTNIILRTCMGSFYVKSGIYHLVDSGDISRVPFDKEDPNTFHNLLSENIGSFSVQWSYPADINGITEYRWWPDDNPDGDSSTSDSNFNIQSRFGFHFNSMASPLNDWNDGDPFYPEALKFTFVIHDKKGVIKDGRKFTHIVYLN